MKSGKAIERLHINRETAILDEKTESEQAQKIPKKSPYRKARILKTAEKLMSKKGVDETSISEIAKASGVADSVIYYYFKNKQDVLFSVVSYRMTEALEKLHEHLLGIEDPLSRLRKMIWFQLYYHSKNKEFSSLYILECKSALDFYFHPAYDLIRENKKIMVDILHDGVQKRVFCDDLNINILTDIIFGTLEWEILSSLVIKEEAETNISDVSDIISLILPVILVTEKLPSVRSDKRLRILLAAEKLFAEKGYLQATISEIARLSDVAEGTIYEYYKNKESLLLAINTMRFGELDDALREIFEIKNPFRKLRRLIRVHYAFYLIRHDFLKIWLLNTQYNPQFYKSDGFDKLKKFSEVLFAILEEGKKDASFRSDINNKLFKNLFLGGYSQMETRWLITGDVEQMDKSREIDEFVSLLTRICSKDGSAQDFLTIYGQPSVPR